jgi:hypothetical protein
MARLTIKDTVLLNIGVYKTWLNDRTEIPDLNAEMTAVKLYAAWEAYTEKHLILALAKHPTHFLEENTITRMSSIPAKLASLLIRDGSRYFNFRSTQDLINKADRIVGRDVNPFRRLSTHEEIPKYLDALGVIRNYVVHQSNRSEVAYQSCLSKTYGLKLKPGGGVGFLIALDRRRSSPLKNKARILGLIAIVQKAIEITW